MAIVNGTLKYKQDDDNIVAIHPIGVDNTARKNALIAVNTIGEWITEHGDTTIATEVKTLNTRVTDLENAGSTQTVYHVPVWGVITGFFNHGFIVTIPMPENLITALVNGKSFSSAVLKRLGGAEGNAILYGYKRNGAAFSLQIPVNTEVQLSRSPTLLEYPYVNTDMDFNADDYGGVIVFANSSIVANGGIFVEVTLN